MNNDCMHRCAAIAGKHEFNMQVAVDKCLEYYYSVCEDETHKVRFKSQNEYAVLAWLQGYAEGVTQL